MAELKLTTAEHFSATHYLQSVVQTFDHANQCHTTIEPIHWNKMLENLKDVGDTRRRVDVSEIGSTWVSRFAARNELRPFTGEELAQIDGLDTFLPTVWLSTRLIDEYATWSIPWLADMRVLYYWRDDLKKAGVREFNAFQTPDHLEETLDRLAARGITPWSAITRPSLNTLFNIASWVWGMGADFVSPDGQHVQFGDANALQGMAAYFSLGRYLPPTNTLISQRRAEQLFVTKQVAATISGPWLLTYFAQKESARKHLPNLGITSPPGPAFVGGTHLVLWDHIDPAHEELALRLIQELTSDEVQRNYGQLLGRMLPVREDVLQYIPHDMERHFLAFYIALQEGRALPVIPMWVEIEEHLVKAFGKVWERVVANPDGDIEAIVEQQLSPIERLLDHLLERERVLLAQR